tara:strand:- start:43 stop:1005 length:963 start_codon:yes stop_codon:yes gene_type:complete
MKPQKKIALIFGINGQDGYYLTKLLQKKNYRVFGITLNSKKNKFDNVRIFKIKKINLRVIKQILNKIKPSKIFNLCSISSKSEAELDILKTDQYINFFNLIFLTSIKEIKLKTKYFLALSALLFNEKKHINEKTKPIPLTHPYAISKYSAFKYLEYFNKTYNLKCYSAFFFNHESPFRDERFITMKIVQHFKIYGKEIIKPLYLKNINDLVDWGHAEDYMEAVLKIVQKQKPCHHIIATGKNNSLKNFIKHVCNFYKIKYEWKTKKGMYQLIDIQNNQIIIQSPVMIKYKNIKIDMKKTFKEINWKPKHSLKDIVFDMCK